MLKELLLVGSGSFIGGVLRYLLSFLIKFDGTHFPYATFLVNIIGCFIIGIIFIILFIQKRIKAKISTLGNTILKISLSTRLTTLKRVKI